MIANPTIRHGSSHPPPFPPLALPLFHSLGTSSRPFALPRCVSVPPFRLEHFSPSSLPSLKWKRHTFRAALEPNSSVGGGAADDGATSTIDKYSVKIPFGSRQILVETGHIGRQASASVTVTDGETIVYCSVCLSDVPSEPSDFFPLTVNYQERLSAAGRTSGGYFKREGRAKDHEVLICRLIDRPLRPTMPKGFYHEIQILSWVFSYDGIHSPDCLAVTAAGIAVALSEVPNTKIIAGVRIGLVGDKFIVNPTTKEMDESELDLIIAGTDSAILMIEGYCNFLTEEKLLEAVEIGQVAIREICNGAEALVKRCGKQKMVEAIKLPPNDLYRHVEDIAGDDLIKALQIKNKIPRRRALSAIEENVLKILTEEGYIFKEDTLGAAEDSDNIYVDEEEEDLIVADGEVDEGDVHIKPVLRKAMPLLFSEVDVKLVFKEVSSNFLRKRIVEDGRRSDGRTRTEIRPINSQCGLLPRAHGSALFTRGETQSLAVVTLGDKQMAQRIDNLEDTEELKRFYLQYSFPPSCVGEVGRLGVPSRREVGHGMLAERAIEPVLPSEEDFPYTIRVESTITESNGSSSMASVCGGCLALLDAGVPIKSSVAGIAMGMVMDTKEFGGDGTPLILSDITGSEDASGDMDFKVAGDENGITAFQMDIKVEGITLPVMQKALIQARNGRKDVLDEMMKCSPQPSRKLSKYAPIIHIMKVKPDKLNIIIGTGGKKVKSIIEDTGVDSIDTEDNGLIKITAKDLSSLEKSKAIIASLTMVPTVGDIYRNCEIKSIAPYGAFVEIAPGREGLCHISELSSTWLAKAEDVIKVGDHIDVKLIEINEKGHLRLSRRALLPGEDLDTSGKQTNNSMKENIPPEDSPTTITVKKPLRKDKAGRTAEKSENPKKMIKIPPKVVTSAQESMNGKSQEKMRKSASAVKDSMPTKTN